MSAIVPTLEVEVYAPGLREGDRIIQLRQQMDMHSRLRYKIDAVHEIVYFETDTPNALSQHLIVRIFDTIGLSARFVGDISDKLPLGDGDETQPLVL